MADRLAVLEGGRISQMGRPDELYRRPANRFTAGFLGDINLIPGRVGGIGEVETSYGIFRHLDTGDMTAGTPVELAIRPESVLIDPACECVWSEELELTGGSYLGEFASWKFSGLTVNEIAPDVRAAGSNCKLGIRKKDVVIFNADGVAV